MRVAALIPLVGFVWNLLLAFFVLSRAPRVVQNRVYFGLGLCIAIWNLGQFFAFTATTEAAASFSVRFLWLGVIFIPLLLFHLSMLVTGTHFGKLIPVFYVLLGALALTLPTNFFMDGVRDLETSGWYAKPRLGLHLATLPFALMFVAIAILVRKRRLLPHMHRSRLTPLIVAQSMLAILGTNDTLPLNGWDWYPYTAVKVYPYGSIASVFYGVIVAYSVLHHQLLDVQIGLSRIAAQVVRLLFLTVITMALLLIATLIFPKAFNVTSLWIALGVFIVSIAIGSRAFPRLFGGTGRETLERRILGDRFEYQDQVRNFIEKMPWYSELPALINDLHDLLTRVFRAQNYQIILRDETTRAFTLFRAHPERPAQQLADLQANSPVFRFFEWGKSEYLTLNSAYPRPSASIIERQSLAQLAEFGGEFCFPMTSQNEPFGLLIIGEKAGGEPYTSTDINLLVALVKNMSLMVNQIRLKTHILQNQELDLLGRMSRGMAHDLNNLLTPIWTLLQLGHEATRAGAPAAFDEELLPSALRNLKIMRAYIREALFFSENLRPDFQLGRLDMLVVQASEVAKVSRKKQVEVITETPGEILVEVDEVLVQRLIANIISNAIDASPEGSTIRVELLRLAKTEANRDWLRVRIVDHGEGIRKEDLNRVFTPYFTTKNHGDEGRGFGLGLAICRKIMNLHGGTLSISSQPKKGTTVDLDLPSRQQKPQPPAEPQPV